jgi:ABC-2 type transport system ATP-binding protein
MAETAVDVRDLHKRYGEVRAVDGATFSIAHGEVFGLLGPNGAGKTTTVECILGLRQPDRGNVTLLGTEDRARSREVRARVGVQLQTTGLQPRLTVRELVALFACLYPSPRPVGEVIELVGLQESAGTRSEELSGGQRQRLAVALALVNDPDLAVLDEPTTGLDPQARRGLWDVVRELRAAGKAVLLTTHYMEEAERLCDRVAVMDHGRVIALDAPQTLIRRHFQETAIELVALGDPPRERLAALPGITQALFEDRHPTLYSTDVPRTMAGLFELVTAGALTFRDVTVRQATLEDVFLKLTGRRIRA